MKKILFIFEDSRFGGPHEFSINLILNLQKRVKCKVYYSDIEADQFSKKIKFYNLDSESFKIFPLSKNFYFFLNYIIFFFSDIIKIKKIILRENPDILYIANGFYGIKVILVCILLKQKFLFHFHDTYCNFFF